MKKLNAYLQKLAPLKRLYLGNISALLGDLLIIFYFTKIIDTFVTKNLVFMQLKLLGYQGATLSQSDFLQFKGILNSNIKLMLFVMILVHAIIYLCGVLKKTWAINYVRRYAFMGAILSLIEFIFYIKNGNGVNFFTFTTVILYGLSFLSLKSFQNEIPEIKKQEQ